jgi:hypothetical protein
MHPDFRRQLAAAVVAFLVTVPALAARQYPAHRFQLTSGTLLLIPDSSAGLIVWATSTRPARPGHRAPPDFVGWFAPERIERWRNAVGALLERPVPDSGKYLESEYLEAMDGGRMSVARSARPDGVETALVFGHVRERPSWTLELTEAEVETLVDSMATLAAASHLDPPSGVGYANPTHRAITPDRRQAPRPDVCCGPGEIWATAALDSLGRVVPESARILWASRSALGKAMLEVLPEYAYQRKDGGVPGRLWVYQRVRVR